MCSLKYPTCNAHAPYCRLSPVRLHNICTHDHKNGTVYGGKKKLFNTKCVFWSSLQLLPETFPILRRTERDIIKKICIGLYVKCPLFLLDFNEIRIFLDRC